MLIAWFRDNEKPVRKAVVPSFQAKGRPITNEEVLSIIFVSPSVRILITYSMLFILKLLAIQSCLLHGHGKIPKAMVSITRRMGLAMVQAVVQPLVLPMPLPMAMAIRMGTRTAPAMARFILTSHMWR